MQTTSTQQAAETRSSDFVRIAAAAVCALVVCFPLFFARRPRTPLRVFCIIAFEYLARLSGSSLDKRRRLAIAHACDFGSLRDEYYDEAVLDLVEYRSLRRNLREIAPEPATIHYIRRLRAAERGRPALSPGIAFATGAYRKSVIELSLRWMERISGVAVGPAQFSAIVDLVCLMQLADDLLDWKEDLAARCPSYVTALLLQPPSAGVTEALRATAKALLTGAADSARRDVAALPFAFAGAATWILIAALLATRPPR